MGTYIYKATNLITEAFDKHRIKYDVITVGGSEQILAGIAIDCGPSAFMRFISTSDDNNIAIRIPYIISKVPDNRCGRVLEACNLLNTDCRYIKFCLDEDKDVSVEFDFLKSIPDEALGEMAVEVFLRAYSILNREYKIFMDAIYSDKELFGPRKKLLMKREFLHRLIEAHKQAEENMESENEFKMDDDIDFDALEADDIA